ncbi:metal ABC transporter solute-binding protein, Zn/Mn family [Streptomyces sp. S186]|uniref:metal ABC transporter solute-binding protein, Zn/Mn family n=1 Tax=Streptomyces sp. S186 TaxID=3434395 RepID=UPI003F66B3D9
MAHVRVSFLSAVALTAGLSLLTACSGGGSTDDSAHAGADGKKNGGPVVVATTTWEAAFAHAAGAQDVKVIVPSTAQHAPDYEPKPSDLAAVAGADYVLYASFEPFAGKIKEAAGSKAELVEVNLDNTADKATAQVASLGRKFGTEKAAAAWTKSFRTEYGKLSAEVKKAWPGGRRPAVVAQTFSTWAAQLAGANLVGTYGPDPVSPGQVSELSAKKPSLILDNVHMSTGTVLPDSGARQVEIANYPGKDLDLLKVYREAASAIERGLSTS